MPTVLLVLPVQTYRANAFLAAARKLEMNVVVASDEPSSLGSFMADRYLTLNLRSPDEAAERAADLASRTPLDGVVGVDESSVVTAAAIAERLGLRHHPLRAVRATRDKRLLRERLATAGVAQPAHRVASTGADPAELSDIAASHGPSVVVKPVDLAASRGVIRADGGQELVAAVERIRRMLDADPPCGAGPWPLIVDEFVPGPEVAVEGLVVEGQLHVLAIFDKPDALDGPFFEETMFVTPSRLPQPTLDEITRVTAEAVAAVGLTNGPVHAELRVGERVRLIEIAARSIGGLCSQAVAGNGAALEELILRHAVGFNDSFGGVEATAAGVLMVPIPGPGTFRGAPGEDAARAVPGITNVAMTIPTGTAVIPLPEGGRYLGFVSARAGTAAEVEDALRAAHALLDVRVD